MFGSSGKSATLAAVSSAAVHTWLRLCLAVLPAVAAGGNFCCVTLKLFFFLSVMTVSLAPQSFCLIVWCSDLQGSHQCWMWMGCGVRRLEVGDRSVQR